MPSAETPPSARRGPEPSEGGSDFELALPAALRDVAPALTLWSSIDEAVYRLIRRCLDGDAPEDWPTFTRKALEAGLVQPGSQPGTFGLRREWVPSLERDLARAGGPDALRQRFVQAWSLEPDLRLVPQIASWASRLGNWNVVLLTWIALNEAAEEFPPQVLQLYAELPVEARVQLPMLSWVASAAAGALAWGRPGAVPAPQGLLLDAAVLHGDWAHREDTDAAVQAGTLRMIGQRRQPSARPGESLEAAWRTKEELDAFVDARSREGRGPTRLTQAVFRTFSAQIALFRAGPVEAINEARWAALLADREPMRVLAYGSEALAMSYFTEEGPAQASDPSISTISDPLGVRGMRGLGEAFVILADGNAALRRLDRAGVERALSQVSAADAAFGGIWALRTAVGAFRDALWGDLRIAHDRLESEVARWSRVGREQDEPLGGAMLGRARTLMLTKSGAFAAAAAGIGGLPDGLRLLPQARIHLWAGQFEQAIRVVDSGAYDQGRGIVDRTHLRYVKAAAALLNGTCDARLAEEAVQEFRRLVASEEFLPIGALPATARKALLDLCGSDMDDEPNFALLLSRLDELNDSGEQGVRPLRLTERERVLLPLLATDDSVPEIARKLQVSVNTVRKQVATLREKFGAATRSDLLRKARNYGALR
jgi:DNA-binding CsgD family transcriptional regulator